VDSDFIIVTGGDAGYFGLIHELLLSIRRLPKGADAPLGVIDAGLTEVQIKRLKELGASIVRPDWPSAVAERRARGRTFLKANLGKAFLDKYFPDHTVIIWLDGDTWVQTWDAIPLFLAGAARGKLAIVSQASRYQREHMALKWRLLGLTEPRSILYKNARRARLNSALARSLATKPVLNAGAFALRRDAPHWGAWRRRQQEVLSHGRLFTSDQLALALAVYIDGLPYEALPEWCNYMGPYRWDPSRHLFVEYFLPYHPVSVMHLAGLDDMRRDSTVKAEIVDLDDRIIRVSLRFSAWHDEAGLSIAARSAVPSPAATIAPDIGSVHSGFVQPATYSPGFQTSP